MSRRRPRIRQRLRGETAQPGAATAEDEGMLRAVVLLVTLVFVGHWWVSGRPIERPPGVLAPNEPRQQDLPNGPTFDLPGHHLRALARFSLEARVLGAERYRFDRGARLAPMDLALGWGPMSASGVLDALDIDQYGRFYFWSARELPIEFAAITMHSANMHIIPATDEVRRTLLSARRGNLVSLEGYLVEVTGDDGFRWRSSLSRGDSGGGACEVVYVERLALY